MSADEVEYVGPFKVYDVVYGGWRVPFLRAMPLPENGVHLHLDRRYGLDLTEEDAQRVVPFLAHAIAVALGYASHPAGRDAPVPRYPMQRMMALHFDVDG